MEPIVENHSKNPDFKKVESIDEITKDPSVSKLYANGFQVGATLADASIMIRHNNQTTAIITMSLPALKSLRDQLDQIITVVSKSFGNIESFDEISKKMK